MKKTAIYLCAGILAFALTACGGKDDGDSSQSTNPTGSTEETQNTAEPSQGGSDEASGEDGTESEPSDQTPDGGTDTEGGWSEEMSGLRAAVVDALGEDNYWPDMPMDAELFEAMFSIGADLYEDYLAESPMIGTNKDTLVIVKAKDDTVDEVERLLTARHDAEVADTMQYPMNLGKIQAGQVEKIGNYVIYVMLGADAVDLEEEDSIVRCQEANKQAIDAIREKIEP